VLGVRWRDREQGGLLKASRFFVFVEVIDEKIVVLVATRCMKSRGLRAECSE